MASADRDLGCGRRSVRARIFDADRSLLRSIVLPEELARALRDAAGRDDPEVGALADRLRQGSPPALERSELVPIAAAYRAFVMGAVPPAPPQ